MNRFSEDDLKAKGFIPDGKGGFSKGKTWIQQQEEKFIEKSRKENKILSMDKDARRKHYINVPIFIPYQVPSKKNSVNISCQFGKPIRYPSDQMKRYLEKSVSYWKQQKEEFLFKISEKEMPYQIAFLFVRATKQRFDYVGPLETVQDLMVEHGWLKDDDSRTMKPILKDFEVDKNKPGVYIYVE